MRANDGARTAAIPADDPAGPDAGLPDLRPAEPSRHSEASAPHGDAEAARDGLSDAGPVLR